MDVILIYIFVVGLCIGSFLNVCIDRIPEEKSIVWPPSQCDNCGCKLKMVDLIPLISYIFLRGKCRKCHQKISFQYPFVEMLNAILYSAIFYKYGLSFYLIKYCILVSFMLVIAVMDIKTHNIYSRVSIAAFLFGCVFDAFGYIFLNEDIFSYAMGTVIGFLVFYIIVKFTKAMGKGDIDAAVICGLFLGKKYIILTILLSFILGGIIAILLMHLNKKRKNEEIAFTPYLALGTYISIFFGDFLIRWYLNYC